MTGQTSSYRQALGAFTRGAVAAAGKRADPDAMPPPLWMRFPLAVLDTIVILLLLGVALAFLHKGNGLGSLIAFGALVTAVGLLKALRRRLGVWWAMRRMER